MSLLIEGTRTESFSLGRSVHFPTLIDLATENQYWYICPSSDGLELRLVHDFCHGAEVSGKVICTPCSDARGFFWITISGSVRIWDLCKKIEEWTEGIPNDSIMVYCHGGLIHFEYQPS